MRVKVINFRAVKLPLLSEELNQRDRMNRNSNKTIMAFFFLGNLWMMHNNPKSCFIFLLSLSGDKLSSQTIHIVMVFILLSLSKTKLPSGLASVINEMTPRSILIDWGPPLLACKTLLLYHYPLIILKPENCWCLSRCYSTISDKVLKQPF